MAIFPRIYLFLACFIPWAAGQTKALDLVFAVDVSESMAEPGRFIREGARLAAYELAPQDRVAVIGFSSSAKLHAGFTSDPKAIDIAFRRATAPLVRKSGQLRLYDGVFAAIEQFPAYGDADRTRSVAVITNDLDGGSSHEQVELIRRARSKGVGIWVFLIGNPDRGLPQPNGGHPQVPYLDTRFAADHLRPLSDETGGKVMTLDGNGYVLRRIIAACKGAGK
ncbi:vWA domain-containing protein [uncultured Paludibaculum sp.]|uniref:vWA domain-containing protein n=1 Tax=uncultured Paludibaculum sp. TaxID=1765020 RepID=UPI002AAB7BE6|nr:vWA domain-containing protein [uncultured Paludibaculum sp.]